MSELKFLNRNGDFVLRGADRTSQLYFPLANEGGMMSSITPTLGGDCKTGQNTWLLAPCSNETLHESRAERSFWLTFANDTPWSVSGQSAAQRAGRAAGDTDETAAVYGGLLWHTLVRESPRRGMKAEVTSFVPAGPDMVELMRVRITNTGRTALTFTPTAAVPLYGRSADNIRDHRHVTSLLQRLTVLENGIRLTPTLTFDERGHRPGQDVYTVLGRSETGSAPVHFLGTVQDYVGLGGSYDMPQALYRPGAAWLHPGDTADGYEMAAVLQWAEVTLAPGESTAFYLALGINCTGADYLSADAFAAALAQTKQWWQDTAAADFTAADDAQAAWLRWVAAQPMLRRICGCSFLPHHDYGRGGRGWRDLWQDSLALLLHDPAATREDLKRYFAGVRADGTNATIIGRAPGEFLADRNNIVRVWMDHGYWPLLTTALYLEQSGDLDFLLEEQPYFCDNRKHRGEQLTAPEPSTMLMQGDTPAQGTILEHLILQNVTAYLDPGPHGNIRLRGADWNDALDMAAENGESVAFTAAYAGNLATLADLCRRLHTAGQTTLLLAPAVAALLQQGAAAQTVEARIAARHDYEQVCENRPAARQALPALTAAEALQTMSDTLKAHLRTHEFVTDGADQVWMNSYYDNDSCPVEGVRGARVRMMLTGQVFSLLSGTADDAQAESIARAADWYLNSPLRGGYCLNTDFGDDIPPLGRQFGFAYGHKENGAVFCHMSVMYAYALYSRGLAERGWKVLQELIDQSLDFDRARIYPGIPEYFDPRGRGMYPYLTGAASWLMLTMLTQVYGVRGENGDLRLEPQLLPEQFAADGTAAVHCRFAGTEVTVTYHNPQGLLPAAYIPARAEMDGATYTEANGKLLIPRTAFAGKPVRFDVFLEQR